jgi:small multidrug resistance family-3 protein
LARAKESNSSRPPGTGSKGRGPVAESGASGWQWWRNGAPGVAGAAGALILVLYGFVPTYQPAHFGRVYAAYGGVFVVLSVLWAWGIDRVAPDRFDVLGAGLCLAGVAVIMYMPRSG